MNCWMDTSPHLNRVVRYPNSCLAIMCICISSPWWFGWATIWVKVFGQECKQVTNRYQTIFIIATLSPDTLSQNVEATNWNHWNSTTSFIRILSQTEALFLATGIIMLHLGKRSKGGDVILSLNYSHAFLVAQGIREYKIVITYLFCMLTNYQVFSYCY